MIGLALHKAGVSESDPRVKETITAAQRFAQDVSKSGLGATVYAGAVCCIFLCDVDPDLYRSEIGIIQAAMLRRQRPNGCWDYDPPQADDTSQTQYGILCLWASHYNGYPVPVDAVERAAAWLMAAQQPGGGWCYRPPLQRGNATGPAGAPLGTGPTDVTHSMTAAGASSLSICADLLGFGAQTQIEKKGEGLPPALVRVERDKSGSTTLRPQRTDPQRVLASLQAARKWFDQYLSFDIPFWLHYYMYGFERYKSFEELLAGKIVKGSDWYNRAVESLRKTQNEDGSWKSPQSAAEIPVDTAFAVLFLTRSSQKMIQKAVLAEGKLIGGHGLPKDLTNARLQDGKVVTPQMVRDVDDLMELLKGAEDKDFDALALPGGLSLDADLTKRTSQLERLRSLVTNEDFNARLVAVKTLARSRELDNVPALIYALSDIDPRIIHEADSGLRFISRKFWGYGLPDSPTPEQKQAAQAKWKEWFLSIRPDAAFLD